MPRVVLLFTFAACASTPAPDASVPDATRDSSLSRDSGARDTGPGDTGSPRDSAIADTGPADSGLPPVLAELEWRLLAGQPRGCLVYRAVNPQEVFDVQWLPCPGVEACQYLDPTTTTLNFRVIQAPGTYDGTQAYVIAKLRRTNDGENRVVLVLGVDSGPVLALRSLKHASRRFPCSTVPILSPTSLGLDVFDVAGDNVSALYHVSLAELGDLHAPVATFSEAELHGNLIQGLALSDTTIAGELQGGGLVFIIDGTQKRIIGAEPPLRGNPQNVHVWGHDVFWEDWPGVNGTRLVHATIDSGPEILVGPTGTDVKTTFLSTSGWLAWMQGSEITYDSYYTYGRVELWSADARDLTNFQPRLLAAIDQRLGIINDGPETFTGEPVIGPDGPTELTTTGEDSFRMYDLARRERRLFPKFNPALRRDDFGVAELIAESPTELFFSGSVGSPRHGTYIRLDKSVWLSSPPEVLPEALPYPPPAP